MAATIKFGGCSTPHLMWALENGARGLWVTKLHKTYTAAARSISRHFAFWEKRW